MVEKNMFAIKNFYLFCSFQTVEYLHFINIKLMNRVQSKKINPLINEIFPEEDLRHKYKVKKIIGKGHYGYVAKAVEKKTNQFVAIKKIINVFQNEAETKRILRQVVLLKNCKHPNVVSLIEVLIPCNQTIQNFDKIYIVTQYCDTDLRKLFQMQETFLQMDDVKFILYQIACGIKYLHSASIIHRDLTPSNILINGQGMKIKICDLGLARVVEKRQKLKDQGESSQQQCLQKQLNNLSHQQKEAIKKQIFNPFQHIDAESIPSSTNMESRFIDQYFGSSTQFSVERNSTNQDLKLKSKDSLKSSTDFDQLRKTQQNQNIQKGNEVDKKKKRLVRMNSKRSEGSYVVQRFEKNQKALSQSEFILKPDQKEKKKKISNNPISKLTLRVTTRWYRAPELILLEKEYNKPIDIWSLGCLFGELLKMNKSVCYSSLQRFPLFPGKYCYPVSPATLCNINRESNKEQPSNLKNDQLFMILSTIGKPTQEDMNFLSDEAAKEYIKSMQDFERKQFKKFFPSVPIEAIQILQATLLFDPNKRIRIDEILNHPFLQSVRNNDFQKEASPVIMQFQEDENLSIQKLRKYLAAEITPYMFTGFK